MRDEVVARLGGTLLLIGVVTAPLSFTMVLDAAAEEAAQTGLGQAAGSAEKSARPAAPQLLSVDIVPDGPRNGGRLAGKEGALPPGALHPNEPPHANDGAVR